MARAPPGRSILLLEVKHQNRNILADTRPVDDQRQLGEPLVAVVIPAYKQPGHLQDAVHSALRQSMRTNIRTVIVNDGCPYESTDELGQLFHSVHPREVLYLRKENGGLSSARNHGVRFALEAWPSIQAIFPLDADNILSPDTIEKLWRSLRESPEDTGWAYHDLNFMGIEDSAWRTPSPFSVYRLAHENICDAGALIHRRVFEAGVWYDESMKSGYEDWEMFLHAALEGFRAIHVPDTHFLYRRHGHTMLKGAQQEHNDIYQTILKKHADRLGPHHLVQKEHQELPRFALIELDRDRVRWTTNVCSDDQSTMSIADYADAVAEWQAEARPKTSYIPPITVIAHGPILEQLSRLRILPGLLHNMQALAAGNDAVFLNYEHAETPYQMTLNDADSPTQPVVMAIPTRRLIEVGRHSGNRLHELIRGGANFSRAGLTLSVGLAHIMHAGGQLENFRRPASATGPHASVIDAAGDLMKVFSTRLHGSQFAAVNHHVYEQPRWYSAPNAYFAAQQQLDRGLTDFPYFAPERAGRPAGTGIWFTTPWIRLGGVDQIVLNTARELAKLCPEYPVHLIVTSVSEIEASPEALDTFDTVTFLPVGETGGEEEMVRVLAGADIIFNAHSRATFHALGQLRSKSAAPVVNMLQVVDPNPFGVPAGYPVFTSRQMASLIDYFVVPSEQLRRTCINFGVPEEKMVIVPNAPATQPPTLEAGLAMAQEKARRVFSSAHPVRILFAGRFDEQKGFDRLGPILEHLAQLKVPFDLRVIGKAVLSRSETNDPPPGVTILPPAQEPAALARYYADSDVFLLPSRWEGVPLTILEAMSFGNVIIATNVGAIEEVVEHGTNGFLVDPDLPENDIAAKISQLIAGIASHSLTADDLWAEAVRTAMSFTWHDAAARLATLVERTKVE